MAERKMEDYQDMIHLPRPVQEHRPHMPMTDREFNWVKMNFSGFLL